MTYCQPCDRYTRLVNQLDVVGASASAKRQVVGDVGFGLGVAGEPGPGRDFGRRL